MKKEIASLLDEAIKDLNLFVDDAFISEEEGQKVFKGTSLYVYTLSKSTGSIE